MAAATEAGPLRQLSLRALHELGGAVFTQRGGWEVPSSYTNLGDEVAAARAGAGILDRSDRTIVRATGADRVTFVNGLVTGDVAALPPGQALYTLVLNPKGKVVGELWVYAEEGAFLLDLDPPSAARVLDHFRKHLISDDVTLEEVPAAHLSILGPSAPQFLGKLMGRAPPEAGRFAAVTAGRRGSVLVARSDELGLPEFELISTTETLDDAWRAALRAGAAPIGRDAWNALRIESGTPLAGVDMTEDTIALEARREGAISYTKGCYEGQETIARATYQGHMNRLLVGFRAEGDTVPRHGDVVTSLEGARLGHVTSGAYSPTVRYAIALGYVRRPSDAPRTRVLIESDGWRLRASVARLPFVEPV